MITLPISDLKNPLESTFDLLQCGDTGQRLSIATGYRKGNILSKPNKLEIWFTPWFLVSKEIPQLAPNHHIRVISGNWDAAKNPGRNLAYWIRGEWLSQDQWASSGNRWDATKAPIGIFWTWSGDGDLLTCDYLVSESMDELASENLFEKRQKSVDSLTLYLFTSSSHEVSAKFHISFVN